MRLGPDRLFPAAASRNRDLVDPALVPAALELGREEGVDDPDRRVAVDEAGGHGAYVRVVVLARERRDFGLPADRRADTLVLGSEVKVDYKNGQGSLTVHFYSDEQLSAFANLLGGYNKEENK